MTEVAFASPHYDLPDAIDRVSDGNPIIFTMESQPVAAAISVRDLRLLDRYIEDVEDRIDGEEMRTARAEPGGPIPFAGFCKDLGV
jgi:hypothetical protein